MSLSDYVIIIDTIPVRCMSITADAKQLDESDEEALSRIAQEVGGTVMPNNSETFSVARNYRNAWIFNKVNKKIDVDLEIVKQEFLISMRNSRNYKLISFDVPFMRALEDGDTEKIQAIKKKKQRLRDLPVSVEDRLNTIIASRKPIKTKLEEIENLPIPELKEDF